MPKIWNDEKSSDWVRKFRQAAILYHNGHFLGVNAIAFAGSDTYFKLIREADSTGPDGRDILIPLLEDPDDYVQVTAARFLANSRPDIAIPVLKSIKDRGVLQAGLTALRTLMIYEYGELDD